MRLNPLALHLGLFLFVILPGAFISVTDFFIFKLLSIFRTLKS